VASAVTSISLLLVGLVVVLFGAGTSWIAVIASCSICLAGVFGVLALIDALRASDMRSERRWTVAVLGLTGVVGGAALVLFIVNALSELD
jgi:fumarate reductase subunit D